MTNRKRSGRRTGTRRRTGRNVWVNQNISFSPADNALTVAPMLTPAAEFMIFDTTIVHTIITSLNWTGQIDDSGGLIQMAIALVTALDTADAADFQTLFLDSIGPTWLYYNRVGSRESINAVFNIPLTPVGAIHVKAKRRFKENNTTLFLLVQTVIEAGTNVSSDLLSGMVRTLIHIP